MASPPNGVYFPSLDECLKGNKLVLYVHSSTQHSAAHPSTAYRSPSPTQPVRAIRGSRDADIDNSIDPGDWSPQLSKMPPPIASPASV